MKYHKCPRCGLNYICAKEQYCKVCLDELHGKPSLFDDDDDLPVCPYCERRTMGVDEIMCSDCFAKRNKRNGNM